MKESNLVSQVTLVKLQRACRQRQIDELTDAIHRLELDGDRPQTRILSYTAIYLVYIAQRLENTVNNSLAELTTRIETLQELCGEQQVDYAIAGGFGVCQGVNVVGKVTSQILSLAVQFLSQSAALALGQSRYRGLPLFGNDLSEDLPAACLQAHESSIPAMELIVKTLRQEALEYEVRAQNIFDMMEVSIASVSGAEAMTSSAHFFMVIAEVLSQPFTGSGVFDNDPAGGAGSTEVRIARALAAGNAAAIVSEEVRLKERGRNLCLN